jgi:hypothetical protein
MKAELTNIQQADYVCATIDSEEQRTALKACAEYLDNPTDEGKHLVRNMLPALRELVESQKRAENICKAIKEIIEPAIYAVKDEAGAFFKFSKESYTSKITDNRALFDRMIGGGIPADILDFATISIKDAASFMGMSESAFRDTFGDLIIDIPRKPTMKAV